MPMNDPIADLLSRIRNAQMLGKTTLSVPSSKVKVAIAETLKQEGYIEQFQVKTKDGKSELEIGLKYYAGRPVIERIERVSRPRLSVFKGRDTSAQIRNGVAMVANNRQDKFPPPGRPASDSTKLPAETLDALSQALRRGA